MEPAETTTAQEAVALPHQYTRQEGAIGYMRVTVEGKSPTTLYLVDTDGDSTGHYFLTVDKSTAATLWRRSSPAMALSLRLPVSNLTFGSLGLMF